MSFVQKAIYCLKYHNNVLNKINKLVFLKTQRIEMVYILISKFLTIKK